MTEFCPQCGTARLGAFRFCQGCRLDFDALPADRGAATASLPAAQPAVTGPVTADKIGRRVTRRRVLIGGLATLFGLAAIGSLTPPDPEPATAAVSTPTPTALATATPRVSDEVVPGPDDAFGPTGPTTEATVVQIIDGWRTSASRPLAGETQRANIAAGPPGI